MDREKSKPQSKASHSRFKPSIIRSDGYVELELSEPVPVEVKTVPEVINSSVIRSRQQLSKEQFGRGGGSPSTEQQQQLSREEQLSSAAAVDEPLNEDSFADLLNSNKLVSQRFMRMNPFLNPFFTKLAAKSASASTVWRLKSKQPFFNISRPLQAALHLQSVQGAACHVSGARRRRLPRSTVQTLQWWKQIELSHHHLHHHYHDWLTNVHFPPSRSTVIAVILSDQCRWHWQISRCFSLRRERLFSMSTAAVVILINFINWQNFAAVAAAAVSVYQCHLAFLSSSAPFWRLWVRKFGPVFTRIRHCSKAVDKLTNFITSVYRYLLFFFFLIDN